MDGPTLSTHHVKVFLAFKAHPLVWYSNLEIADLSGVAHRTARLHTAKLAKAGVLDQEQVFPGYRFRLAAKPTKPAQDYVTRLARAAQVFGLRKEQSDA